MIRVFIEFRAHFFIRFPKLLQFVSCFAYFAQSSVNANAAPASSPVSISVIFCPCISMMRWQMLSPSPVPLPDVCALSAV